MASTIKQRRQLAKLDEFFVGQRRTVRDTGQYFTDQFAAGRAKDPVLMTELANIGQAWQARLDQLVAVQSEAQAAVTEIGGDLSDFQSRLNELQSAANALTTGLTTSNVEARLSAMANLTEETIF